MQLEELEQYLHQSFHPPAATGFDGCVRLLFGEQALWLQISGAQLTTHRLAPAHTDATFIFADLPTGAELFTGRRNAFEAFMAGAFRADSYLMWTFAVMAMFGSAALPVTPTE